MEYDPQHFAEVCRRQGLRLVVLFGSRARGSPSPAAESDLDLAVLGGRDGVDLWKLYQELAKVFRGVELDLVLLHQADPLLRYEVLRRGKLLYGDPDEFLEYRAFAFRDFVDSADLRRLEQKLFAKKLAFLRRELDGAA